MRSLGREHIVLPEDGSLVNFNKMISFNSSAAYLWEAVGESDFTVSTLEKLLKDKYDVDDGTAALDADKIANSWKEIGIVED